MRITTKALAVITFTSTSLLIGYGFADTIDIEKTADLPTTSQTIQCDTPVQRVIQVTPDTLETILHQLPSLISACLTTLEFEEGSYHLTKPIILTADHSGTVEAPFTIRPAEQAKVIVSGSQIYHLDWIHHENGIYKATLDLDSAAALFINQEKQILARYPNYDESAAVYKGTDPDAISSRRVSRWENPAGGYVHTLHARCWGDMHYRILCKDTNNKLNLEGGYQNNRPSPMNKTYRFVENIFEELDAPHEWFFDAEEKQLYYYPPENMDLSQAQVEIAHLKHLIEIQGTQEQPVQNIRIQGLDLSQTTPTFMESYEPLLRSDWKIYRGGAVLISNAKNIYLYDNELHDLGGNAVMVSGSNDNIIIESNHIYDIGASAICFIGHPSAVRSPSFNYYEYVSLDDMDFTKGPKNNRYPTHCVASNNLIHDIGLIEKQVAGVQLSMSSGNRVSHNTIYRVPRAGINVSEGTWAGHIIEYNDVFATVLETSDHGAFNSWGRDRFWHPNREVMNQINKQHPDMYSLDSQNPTIIRHNRFQCDHGWDIDLDDGSSNYEIYNNIALSGGIKLREGFHRSVYNNIIINNSFHPHVWFQNSHDRFEHNIVFTSYRPADNHYWGDEINYNFFTSENDLLNAQALGLDQNSLSGDPEFVSQEDGDYRVSISSGAAEVGFANFTMDQFGVTSEKLIAIKEQSLSLNQPKSPGISKSSCVSSGSYVSSTSCVSPTSSESSASSGSSASSDLSTGIILSILALCTHGI